MKANFKKFVYEQNLNKELRPLAPYFLMALGVQKEKKDILIKLKARESDKSLQMMSRHSKWLTPSRDNMVLQC